MVSLVAREPASSILRDCRHDSRIIDMITTFFLSLYIFSFYGLAAVFRRLHEKHIIARHDWTWFLPASRTTKELVIGKVLESGRVLRLMGDTMWVDRRADTSYASKNGSSVPMK
jgi:hypothetical protein